MLYMSVYFYAIHAAEPEAATTICFVSSEHQINTCYDSTCNSDEYCGHYCLHAIVANHSCDQFTLCSVTGNSSTHGYQQLDTH